MQRRFSFDNYLGMILFALLGEGFWGALVDGVKAHRSRSKTLRNARVSCIELTVKIRQLLRRLT
jgi:hypothetical protein